MTRAPSMIQGGHATHVVMVGGTFMCTLVAAFQTFSRRPLVIAANRDERLSRPSSPPRLFVDGDALPHLAPVDEQAHGTWLGITARGMFVGITNRFGEQPDASRRSRGLLVKDALRHPSARSLRNAMSELDPSAVNAFHLFYSDGREAYVSWSDGEKLQHLSLEPGVHVITERSFAAHAPLREAQVQTLWASLQPYTEAPDVEGLQLLLAQHEPSDTSGSTCVHLPSFGYGTRSSLVYALGATLAQSELAYADGPPCQTPFESLEAQLAALDAAGQKFSARSAPR